MSSRIVLDLTPWLSDYVLEFNKAIEEYAVILTPITQLEAKSLLKATVDDFFNVKYNRYKRGCNFSAVGEKIETIFPTVENVSDILLPIHDDLESVYYLTNELLDIKNKANNDFLLWEVESVSLFILLRNLGDFRILEWEEKNSHV